MLFLVTAGNTREPIDHVRDWGNIFTGNTGYAIARALADVGEVHLLTSNPQHLAEIRSGTITPHPLLASGFTTHADLKSSLDRLLKQQTYDAIFMTAAVSDYRPVRTFAVVKREPDPDDPNRQRWIVEDVQKPKITSTHSAIAILGEPTEKLVDLFRKQWNHQGLLVKFKLEVAVGEDELLKIGESSRLASQADYLVANTLEMVNGPRPGAYLLREGGHDWVARERLPHRMVELVRPD